MSAREIKTAHRAVSLAPTRGDALMPTLAPASLLISPQPEIVDFIKEFIATHGYPPSVREIRDAVGVKSTSTVHFHLTQIEQAGVIERRGKHSRAIRVLAEDGLAA